MASTLRIDGSCCPERAEQGWPAPGGRSLLVLGLVATVLMLVAGPAVIAVWSIADSHPLDRFYQSESASAGLIIQWLQLPAQGILVYAASLLPSLAAER